VRLVVALGGNALLRRASRPRPRCSAPTCATRPRALAPLARDHELVLTHGQRPADRLARLQAEATASARPDPLDVLGAESEALIGYLIEQELAPLLPEREIATLVTLVEVDAADRAFAAPTKPIGPRYAEAAARAIARERGWQIASVEGGFRRVVPSPEPHRIRELGVIRTLVEAGRRGDLRGGGGIPVVTTQAGGLRGVEAVIDKDLTAALLATELGADALLLLTDVAAVYEDWPRPCERAIRSARPAELRARAFAAGSMGPKVEAACRFRRARRRPRRDRRARRRGRVCSRAPPERSCVVERC